LNTRFGDSVVGLVRRASALFFKASI